jgi:hypothetical protein
VKREDGRVVGISGEGFQLTVSTVLDLGLNFRSYSMTTVRIELMPAHFHACLAGLDYDFGASEYREIPTLAAGFALF